MPKAKVPIEFKRLVISARVTPQQKTGLLALGSGNISRGFDALMATMDAVHRTLALPAPGPAEGDTELKSFGARISAAQRSTLQAVGEGNISLGLERIMQAMNAVWNSWPQRPPVAAILPPTESGSPAVQSEQPVRL